MSAPSPTPRKFPRMLLLVAFLALVAGIALIVMGFVESSTNGVVYGFALLTVSALLGLSIMNRMFPKR